MKIITHQCPECETVVAGNVLERRRVMKCPRTACHNILRFEQLPETEREHLVEHRAEYGLTE